MRIHREVNQSVPVFETLVSMLVGKERHQECLVKVSLVQKLPER